MRVVPTPGLDSEVYGYDARGRLSQVQTGGRVASYTYDAAGRLIRQVLRDGCTRDGNPATERHGRCGVCSRVTKCDVSSEDVAQIVRSTAKTVTSYHTLA
jgi:YD repeat-containing protein